MAKTAIRIGRVKMKSGGADVRVLHRPKRKDVEAALIEDAVTLADSSDSSDGLTGYAIVTWGRVMDAGVSINFADATSVNPDSIPSFVKDRLAGTMRAYGLAD